NSFWIKLDNNTTSLRTIWYDIPPARTIDNSLELENGKLFFKISNDADTDYKNWYWTVSANSLTSWTHIAITWDGDFTSFPKLYINGSLKSLYADLGTEAGSTRAELEKLTIFDRPTSSGLYELQGKLQEMAFYNKVLSPTEILEIYNNGKYLDLSISSVSGDVLDYWRLGEEPGLDSYEIGDSIPNSTIVNATIGSANLTASNNITVDSGFHGSKDLFSYENDSLATLPNGDNLVALNIHRNGPYGHNTFKQLRSSQNPLTRYHNKNSIFSYVLDGNTIKSNGLEVFKAKNTNIRQIEESPIITNNKPLTLVGGVSEYNRRTKKTTIERVEVQASPTNEIQFFGDKQANREFGLDYETHDSYEDLTNLYLDGGIESDDSPLDQFELLRYRHQVYPREGNTYLGHVRGRPNFISGYWRDTRNDRTEIDVDNGFGFGITSQSMWPLDVEEGWATRDLISSIGTMTMSAPTEFVWTAHGGGGFPVSSSGITIDPDTIPTSGDEIYLYTSQTTFNQDITYVYDDSGTPFGYIHKGKYRLNSSRGVQRFYNAWTGLMEQAGFRIESTNPSIATRENVDTIEITYADNDPYYLEIDNVAGASHFTTELSHSLVHYWTKNENFIDGYVYNEIDSSGKNKRFVSYNNSDVFVGQSALYGITNEDGTHNSYLTSSNSTTGRLLWKYELSNYSSYIGNEWNNKIISFGDPKEENNEAIKLYSNGTLI
ncbi:MAG: LamG-like jellyroll fold domain-containing protein, partial [Planctomycetota bacterium]